MQKKLYELFLADQQLKGMRSRLDAALKRHQVQKTRLSQLQQQKNELTQQHLAAQANAQSFEHQARDMEAKVEHLRQQMNAVRNNKEYSALLVEVNTLKIEKGKMEEQALGRMEEVDRFAGLVRDVETRLVEQQKLTALAEQEVQKSKTDLGHDIEKLTAARQTAAEQLTPDLLDIYEKAARTHDDGAMAEVIEEDRRHMEYTCGGCYMSIPVELLNSLLSKNDKPAICPNCGRLLYVADQLKTSLNEGAGSRR